MTSYYTADVELYKSHRMLKVLVEDEYGECGEVILTEQEARELARKLLDAADDITSVTEEKF